MLPDLQASALDLMETGCLERGLYDTDSLL